MNNLSSAMVVAILAATGSAIASEPPEIIASTAATVSAQPEFVIYPLPPPLLSRMRQTSWHQGCPAPLEQLRLLTLSYWDFSGIARAGTLIVNSAVANDVQFVFQHLYDHGFLIERMQPVEEYNASDDQSMAANNTSSFNCRDVTGKPGKFSNHSWGRAIDINPLTNPMLLHGKFLPPAGASYANRTKAAPGSILAGSFIVRMFKARGWAWGGDWAEPDYQHFEKPVDPGK